VAEGTRLLSEYGGKPLSRVRIPPSPLQKMRELVHPARWAGVISDSSPWCGTPGPLGDMPAVRMLARMLLDELSDLDQAVYGAVARSPTPHIDRAMALLSDAANYSRLSLASAAALAVTRGERGRSAAALGLASVAVTAAVVNLAIKPLGHRERPDRATHRVPVDRWVRMPRSTSLPSGHTAAAFAFASGVSDVLPWEGAALKLLATAVGYSRVHTGVHYPSDVIFGALIGTVTSRIVVKRLGGGERRRCAGATRESGERAPEPGPKATVRDGRGRFGPAAPEGGS
jgi:membrane-associated phospholipid phosphatase